MNRILAWMFRWGRWGLFDRSRKGFMGSRRRNVQLRWRLI